MKRITTRSTKPVAVSAQALARARGALQAFGTTTADLQALANFKGDVTVGPTTAIKGSVKADRWVAVKPSKAHSAQRTNVKPVKGGLGHSERVQAVVGSGKPFKVIKIA